MSYIPENTFGNKEATEILVQFGAAYAKAQKLELTDHDILKLFVELGERAFNETNLAIKEFSKA